MSKLRMILGCLVSLQAPVVFGHDVTQPPDSNCHNHELANEWTIYRDEGNHAGMGDTFELIEERNGKWRFVGEYKNQPEVDVVMEGGCWDGIYVIFGNQNEPCPPSSPGCAALKNMKICRHELTVEDQLVWCLENCPDTPVGQCTQKFGDKIGNAAISLGPKNKPLDDCPVPGGINDKTSDQARENIQTLNPGHAHGGGDLDRDN